MGNIRRSAYDADLLRFAGVREEQLPLILCSGDIIGNLTEEAAKELGLTTETVLVAGAHDQYAVALGAGACKDGDILIGSGTCWVVTAIGKEADFASGLSQSVAAVPGLWGSLFSLSTGGVCLEWLRKNIAKGPSQDLIDFRTLDAEAEGARAAEDGLFFFPFAGRYANGRFTKASFTGLDLSHTRFHMARAVMEGVVFQILWFLEKFKTQPGEDGITLAGGASKSPIWAQLLADVSGLPVRIPALADLACVGAALMAGMGGGIYETPEEGYRRFAVEERVLLPDQGRHAIYAPLFAEYKKQANALGALHE
jgi:xylulokinase